MARRKKDSNWDLLREQSPSESVKTRDVYESQQLERTTAGAKRGPGRAMVLATVIAAVAAALFYLILSLIVFSVVSLGGAISQGLTGAVGPGGGLTVDLSAANPVDYGLVGFGTGPGDGILIRVPGKSGPETAYYHSGMSLDGFLAGLQDELGWSTKPGSLVASDGMIAPDGTEYSTGWLQALWEDTQQAWEFCIARGMLFQAEGYVARDGVLDAEAAGYSREAYSRLADLSTAVQDGLGHYLLPTTGKTLATLAVFAAAWGISFLFLLRVLAAENQPMDLADVNQYPNDQHIALPEEIQSRYDWFPDVGARSSVQVSSMLSHMALRNKGVDPVLFTRRAAKDVKDDGTGDVIYYKGEVLLDEEGEPVVERVPMLDEKFMQALFEASGAPEEKKFRFFYDPSQIPYNPGNKDRDKLKGCDTVADLINKDWELPDYEPQRPGGAYVVDTQPVNTMV